MEIKGWEKESREENIPIRESVALHVISTDFEVGKN